MTFGRGHQHRVGGLGEGAHREPDGLAHPVLGTMISTTASGRAPGIAAAIGRLALVLLAGALWVVHSTGPAPADAGPVDYIGRVEATGALVGVVTDGPDVTAYVMGRGEATGERFVGVLVDDVARMRATDGAGMVLRLVGGAARGTVTPLGGRPSAFTTAVVEGGPTGPAR